MEIFFAIISAVFAIAAGIFGVRNRVKNSKPGTRGNLRDIGQGLDDLISRVEQLEQFEQRADDSIKRVNEIGSRIRKKEPEATKE